MKKAFSFLKYILIILIFVLIIKQLNTDEASRLFTQLHAQVQTKTHLLLLLAIIILMPLNWCLESKKWQLLMSPFVHVSLKQSLRIVIAGIAAGIFTPGRVGEYAGRVITSDKNKKMEVISATLLGSISQNLWNIAGGLGFCYFFLKNVFPATNGYVLPLLLMVAIQIVILLFLYYNLPKVTDFMVRKTFIRRYKNQLTGLKAYSAKILNKTLFLSFLRYLTYIGQYVLTMLLFNVEVAPLVMIGNITGIILIQTGIPLPMFLSILARGELAILVWSTSGVDSLTALAATFLIWFINLIVPAVIGLFILTKVDVYKYFKKITHE